MTDTTLPGVLLKGAAASRPAASSVAKGTIYSATDTGAISQSDGSSWSTYASGVTDPTMTRGDLIVRNNAGSLTRLALGAANTLLHGSATDPSYSAVLPADLDVSADNATANATTGHHGLVPKGDGNAAHFLAGDLSWGTPAGSGTTLGFCLIYNSATQSIAMDSSGHVLTFDSEDYDPDGYHSTASNTSRITIPTGKGGANSVFYVRANTFAGADPGGSNNASFQKTVSGPTTSKVRGSGNSPKPNAAGYWQWDAYAYGLLDGDYVEAVISGSSGGSVNFGHASALEAMSTFMLVKLA